MTSRTSKKSAAWPAKPSDYDKAFEYAVNVDGVHLEIGPRGQRERNQCVKARDSKVDNYSFTTDPPAATVPIGTPTAEEVSEFVAGSYLIVGLSLSTDPFRHTAIGAKKKDATRAQQLRDTLVQRDTGAFRVVVKITEYLSAAKVYILVGPVGGLCQIMHCQVEQVFWLPELLTPDLHPTLKEKRRAGLTKNARTAAAIKKVEKPTSRALIGFEDGTPHATGVLRWNPDETEIKVDHRIHSVNAMAIAFDIYVTHGDRSGLEAVIRQLEELMPDLADMSSNIGMLDFFDTSKPFGEEDGMRILDLWRRSHPRLWEECDNLERWGVDMIRQRLILLDRLVDLDYGDIPYFIAILGYQYGQYCDKEGEAEAVVPTAKRIDDLDDVLGKVCDEIKLLQKVHLYPTPSIESDNDTIARLTKIIGSASEVINEVAKFLEDQTQEMCRGSGAMAYRSWAELLAKAREVVDVESFGATLEQISGVLARIFCAKNDGPARQLRKLSILLGMSIRGTTALSENEEGGDGGHERDEDERDEDGRDEDGRDERELDEDGRDEEELDEDGRDKEELYKEVQAEEESWDGIAD